MVEIIGIGIVVAAVWLVAYGMASASGAEGPRSSTAVGASGGDKDKATRSETRHAA